MAERKHIVKTKIKSNYFIKFINNKNILSVPSHSDAKELHDAVNSALSIAKSFKRSISAVSVATAITTLQTKLYRLLWDSFNCLCQPGSILPIKIYCS